MKLVSKTKVKNNTPHSYLIPSIIAMGFIPLIVCYYQFDSMMEQFDWYPNSAAYQADVYLAVKSFAIIFIAAVMVIMLLYRHLKTAITNFLLYIEEKSDPSLKRNRILPR